MCILSDGFQSFKSISDPSNQIDASNQSFKSGVSSPFWGSETDKGQMSDDRQTVNLVPVNRVDIGAYKNLWRDENSISQVLLQFVKGKSN